MSNSEKRYFEYGQKEIEYLKKKDVKLAKAMEDIGMIKRELTPDLFENLINSISGQQISGKALATVWARLVSLVGEVTPERIFSVSLEEIQQCGMSMRKATYIKGAAEAVLTGKLDLDSLREKSDMEVCEELSSLNGIGIWTAEMLMIFSMERPDIVSYGDFAILRGIRMLYRHKKIDKKLFEKYKSRYSPYGTIASLYLWAIAGGAIEGLTDPAQKQKVQ